MSSKEYVDIKEKSFGRKVIINLTYLNLHSDL